MASPMPAFPYNAAPAPTMRGAAAGWARSRLVRRAPSWNAGTQLWQPRHSGGRSKLNSAWYYATFGPRPDSAMHVAANHGRCSAEVGIDLAIRERGRRSLELSAQR
jgi:hypothetical protein